MQIERSLLLDCLRKNRGNQTSAACELGLPRRTLLYRMQRLSISPADVYGLRRRACSTPPIRVTSIPPALCLFSRNVVM